MDIIFTMVDKGISNISKDVNKAHSMPLHRDRPSMGKHSSQILYMPLSFNTLVYKYRYWTEGNVYVQSQTRFMVIYTDTTR
jgi:hypothetical protein